MRKIGSFLLIGAMAVSLAGCGGQGGQTTTAAETTKAADTQAESKEEADTKETESEEAGQEEETSEAAKAGGTFTVGFDQDFPPMGFVGDDGEYTGFDLELAKETADRLGLEFVPQPIAWDAKDIG